MQTFVILVIGLIVVGGVVVRAERRRGRKFLRHDRTRDRTSAHMAAERERAVFHPGSLAPMHDPGQH